jgi:hypothetical protein
MSSTNRGYDRHTADYYVTPKKNVKEFLSAFLVDEQIDRPDRLVWLDPCCGGDKDNEASYVSILKEEFDPTVIAIDIREDSHADIVGDFINDNIKLLTPNIIISNPPFYLAGDFIKKSLELVAEGGYVIMLLRLNYFGSSARKQFFEENMPFSCYIHHKRINFIPDSMKQQMIKNGLKPPSGDSIEYAHFVWKKGVNNKFCKTYLI